MKNQDVIESIQLVETPKLQACYPQSRVHGRVITTKVVGVTFEGRQEVVAKLQMGDRVWLEMEPSNPYDANAIMVSRSNGEQIGYLNRHLAARIIPYFKAYRYAVKGKVTLLTGSSSDGFTLGCVIIFTVGQAKNTPSIPGFDDWED